MRWNPVEYDDVQIIRISPDKVWLPDIVLFNKSVFVGMFFCLLLSFNFPPIPLFLPPFLSAPTAITKFLITRT